MTDEGYVVDGCGGGEGMCMLCMGGGWVMGCLGRVGVGGGGCVLQFQGFVCLRS